MIGEIVVLYKKFIEEGSSSCAVQSDQISFLQMKLLTNIRNFDKISRYNFKFQYYTTQNLDIIGDNIINININIIKAELQ